MKSFDHSFTVLKHWIHAPESTLFGEDLHVSLFCMMKNENFLIVPIPPLIAAYLKKSREAESSLLLTTAS